jgi:sugar O-acyltransferase (sialic acid O-acetyltransferase NeuD family)
VRYLLIGAAGHAQEVAWALTEQLRARGEASELRFFDDNLPLGRVASGLGDVVGPLDAVREHLYGDEVRLVLAVGQPRTKAALVARLGSLAVRWATVIHPTAVVGPNVTVREGSYVAAGAVVTVNAKLGRFVTVNVHCLVAHDDVVGDLATLHPDVHLSGNVSIGTGVELGAGSLVIQGTTIGDWAILGAGCVATRSLEGHETWVGVPAARVSRRPHERHAMGER